MKTIEEGSGSKASPKQIQVDYLIANGWIRRPAPAIIGDSWLLDIGRRRKLILSNIENPNQMLMIGVHDENGVPTDLVTIHNWDYDKWLSLERLELIVSVFQP